jgi:hypothetical protein
MDDQRTRIVSVMKFYLTEDDSYRVTLDIDEMFCSTLFKHECFDRYDSITDTQIRQLVDTLNETIQPNGPIEGERHINRCSFGTM